MKTLIVTLIVLAISVLGFTAISKAAMVTRGQAVKSISSIIK